ncbi:EamA family transporter [Candidatus Woesearchaeota archaeon]|nr:EamA family transporter [Candidatus Woesearchaeota archaeon]
MIPGIFLALGGAFLNAVDNILMSSSKKNYDALSFAFGKLIIAALICYIPVFLVVGININSIYFWPVLLITVLVDGIAAIYYIKALHISGVGHTIPLLSITPALILIWGFFIGEIPTWLSASGVMMIVIGVYVLNISKNKEGILEPLLYVFKNKGSLMMFIIAIVYSINAVLFRFGYTYSDQFTFLGSVGLGEIVLFSIILFFKKKPVKKIFTKDPLLLAGSAIAVVIGNILVAFAYNFLQVSYAIAMKRITILFSVIFGILFLKEKFSVEKLIGSVIIVAGVMLIAFYG